MKHAYLQMYKATIILLLFFTSCSSDDGVPVNNTLEISQEIKDLIYFQGEEDASIVLINAQAGADTELSRDEVDGIFEIFDTTDLLAVNVHQAQTLNPDLVENSELTFDQAIDLNTESVELLYKVVKYFKDQGRTVYILGISFGAFITQELIAERGIDVADDYLVMIGRLDMNDVVWQASSEGRFAYFENGITPVISEEPEIELRERNTNRIVAGLGMNRYTNLLNAIEDLSNMTYIYGETDEAVGALTDLETEFLRSRNANIIVGSGGHDQTIDDFLVRGFNEAFGISLKQVAP